MTAKAKGKARQHGRETAKMVRAALLIASSIGSALACSSAWGQMTQPSSQPAIMPGTAAQHPTTRMSGGFELIPHDSGAFRPDPYYGDKPYSAADQAAIYGAKHLNPTQRPLLEVGRELYQFGPFSPPSKVLGSKNPVDQHLWVYGDWRTAFGYNDDNNKNNNVGLVATRLNLDIDYQFTSTERIHAFIRPFDKNGEFDRYVFAGDDTGLHGSVDANIDALFFEGDAAAMWQGFSNKTARFDLPFAVGRIPLLLQNGVWMIDAVDGFAVTLQAQNSPKLDISNMDFTFFAGFNNVDTPAVDENNDARIYGVAGFLETMGGYWEIGYGYTDENSGQNLSYHNVTAAFTRRYGNFISNSVRGIWNFGQDPEGGRAQTADGFLLLVENSFMTGEPQQTVVPYLNLFAGFDHPQSLARDPGAGGVLVNTGILFETDGLTGLPTLDATAANTIGGAIGCEFLFDLNQQIVIEAAMVNAYGSADETNAEGNEYGVGVRYQKPINNAMLFRVNAMYGVFEDSEDVAGADIEFRWKF